MRGLLIVDVQQDFLPGGALGVPHGDEIIPEILKRLDDYSIVVASRDWHPPDHISFAKDPRYEDKSWPVHCVQNTSGAEIASLVQRSAVDGVVSKGYVRDQEAYSAFDGTLTNGLRFEEWVHEIGVTELDIAGLALDYCVKASALDAAKHGLHPRVILSATKAVTPETGLQAVEALARNGVSFIA